MNNFLILKNTYININHIVYIKKYKKGEWILGYQYHDDTYLIHLDCYNTTNDKTNNKVLEITKTLYLDDYITVQKFIENI